MWRRWPQKTLNFGPCDRTITARSSKAWSIASEICCAIGMEGPTALPAPADATQSRGPLAVASGHTPNLADTTACRARLIPKLGARTTRRLIFVGRMRHSVRASSVSAGRPLAKTGLSGRRTLALRFVRPSVPVIHRTRWRFRRVKAYLVTRCACTLLLQCCPMRGRLRRPKGESNVGPSRIKKRSIVVNGHKTSISLEDEFWNELRDLAAERRVPVTALVNEIDQVPGRNLSSAIRVHLFMQAQQRRSKAA